MKIRMCAMECGNELFGYGDICTQCTRLVARHKEKRRALREGDEFKSGNKSRKTEAA